MRRAKRSPVRPLVVVVLAILLSLAPFHGRAHASSRVDPLDRAIDVEDLLGPTADDDDLDDRSLVDPIDLARGAFGVSLRGAVGRFVTPVAPAMRWEIDVSIYFPLDRLLGLSPRAPALPTLALQPLPTGIPPMSNWKLRRRVAAILAPFLGLGGAVWAKDKPKPAPSSSSSVASASVSMSSAPSPTVVTSASPSVAGTAFVVEPLGAASMQGLVRAAWKNAGLDRDDALDDLASRAKSSALAPEVRLRAHRTLLTGARVFSEDTLTDHTTISDGNQTFLEARLTWRLDRLVFADDEIAIERLKLERAELKQRIAARVVELVTTWHRARRASLDPELLAIEREEAAALAVESFLALDAYTGGAASSVLAP